MPKCFLCQTTELDRSTKPEHVLNDALGGRKATRGAICSVCNGRLGSTADKELAIQVRTIRSMFSMASGNGQQAPALKGVKSGDITFNIGGDGRLELVSKPFEITYNDDGTFSLQITARSEDEIARSFANAAAKLKMTVEELITKTMSVSGHVQDRPPGVVMHAMSFGGLECSRSMMKSALVLWSTEVGNAELHKACYDEARRFVLDGGLDRQASLTAMDERDVERHATLADEFGPLFNYIAVASDDRGRVKAFFSLYGLYALCMTLAPTGGVASRKAVLVSNPLDPGRWSDDSERHMFIDAAWMDQPRQSDDASGFREKLNKMGAYHQQFSRERMITTTIEDIWTKQFPDLTEIDIENGMPLINEISYAISHNLVGLPRSKPLMNDDLVNIVRRKI